MELIEKNPLPQRCIDCPEAKEAKELGLTEDAYYYNCDFALDRWTIARPKVALD